MSSRQVSSLFDRSQRRLLRLGSPPHFCLPCKVHSCIELRPKAWHRLRFKIDSHRTCVAWLVELSACGESAGIYLQLKPHSLLLSVLFIHLVPIHSLLCSHVSSTTRSDLISIQFSPHATRTTSLGQQTVMRKMLQTCRARKSDHSVSK